MNPPKFNLFFIELLFCVLLYRYICGIDLWSVHLQIDKLLNNGQYLKISQ